MALDGTTEFPSSSDFFFLVNRTPSGVGFVYGEQRALLVM